MSLFEIISVVLSSSSLIISIYVFYKNKGFSTAMLEIELAKQISSAKEYLYKAMQDYSVLQHEQSPLGKTAIEQYENAIDSVLSVYDTACCKYLAKKIKQKTFRTTYTYDIEQLFEDKTFSKYLLNDNKYHYLKDFYNQHQDK